MVLVKSGLVGGLRGELLNSGRISQSKRRAIWPSLCAGVFRVRLTELIRRRARSKRCGLRSAYEARSPVGASGEESLQTFLMPTIRPSVLQSFAAQLLQAGGTSSDESKLVAASLVDANLKGYDSHGVM